MKIERKTSGSTKVRGDREYAFSHKEVSEEFLALLTQEKALTAKGEIDSMVTQVQNLGDALVYSQSFSAVQAYRTAVKKLVDHIVKNGLAVKNEALSDTRGRKKLYAIWEEIDGHLLSLLQQALHNQLEPLAILHVVGEVKGLLISLQT